MAWSRGWPSSRRSVACRPGSTSSSLPRSRRLSVLTGTVTSWTMPRSVEPESAGTALEVEVVRRQVREHILHQELLLGGQALERPADALGDEPVVLHLLELLGAHRVVLPEQIGDPSQRDAGLVPVCVRIAAAVGCHDRPPLVVRQGLASSPHTSAPVNDVGHAPAIRTGGTGVPQRRECYRYVPQR